MFIKIAALAAALLLAAPAGLAQAQTPAKAIPYDQTFTTRHEGVFNGQKVRYTATVGSTVLKDETGAPVINFVTTAYVRDDVKDKATRPVMFVWGGGPSAASTVLQMRFFGPRISTVPPIGAEAGFEPTLKDNPESVLDATDMVFVDPAESGFTRVLPAGKRAWFYGLQGDPKSIAQFIQTWMKANGREASPLDLQGQSYGSVRIIRVAEELAKTRAADGLIVTGNSAMVVEAGRANSIIAYALALPTTAITAVAHGAVDRAGRSDKQIIDQSYDFATREYLPALARVQDISPAERARIAARLSAFTGVSAADYEANDIVVSGEQYRAFLVRTKGKSPDRSDVRRTAQLPDVAGKAYAELMTKELGVTYPMSEFRGSAPDTGNWDYGPPNRFAGNDWPGMLLAHMKANPKVRYLSINGFQDGTSIIGSVRYLFSRTPLPKDRVVVREYEGGHSVYTTEASRKAALADVRAFVSAR